MNTETPETPKIRRLPINLGTDLQVEIERTETRFKSTLVGVYPDHFLLIKMPLSDEILQQLLKHPIVVRYIFKGAVLGFRTSFISSLSDPIRMAFFQYPEEFENIALRNKERYECFLPIRMKIKEAEKRGALLDVSKEGIRIAIRDRRYVPTFLKQEDPVSVYIQFPGSPREEEFMTLVKRISDEGGRVILGLVYSDLNFGKRTLITKFVNEIKEFK